MGRSGSRPASPALKSSIPKGAANAPPYNVPAVLIQKGLGASSALDIKGDGTGKMIRFNGPGSSFFDGQPETYFNDIGALYTRGWETISGTSSGTGDGFNIIPPSNDPYMLGLWSDVAGPAMQVRASVAPGSYLFSGMDQAGNYTFSVGANGQLQWGAGSQAALDTALNRAGPGALSTPGSLRVGSPSAGSAGATLQVNGGVGLARTAVASDYTLASTDLYVAVTDASAPRTLTLPSAQGLAGQVFMIKDESGAAAAHPITLRAQTNQTINGTTAYALNANYGVVRLMSNGSNWITM